MKAAIPDYPKVHALGHAMIPDLLDGYVWIQEKYDGSQFSWRWDEDGVLHARSKGKAQAGPECDVTDKLFLAGVDYLQDLEPRDPNYIYRAEYFSKPKHNVMAYPRMPKGGFVLYDIEMADTPSAFWNHNLVSDEAEAMGIEVAQDLNHVYGSHVEEFGVWELEGSDLTMEKLEQLLQVESSLGGPIEGITIKNYNQFKRDGKVQMGKLVRPEFKEVHRREWKEKQAPVLDMLAATLNTEARWEKAVQHLREQGELQGAPQDIGPLMRRVKQDTIEEEEDFIRAQLWADAKPKLERKLGRGLPEWYKARLAEAAFFTAGAGLDEEPVTQPESDALDTVEAP